jgi:hypothetical protein
MANTSLSLAGGSANWLLKRAALGVSEAFTKGTVQKTLEVSVNLLFRFN